MTGKSRQTCLRARLAERIGLSSYFLWSPSPQRRLSRSPTARGRRSKTTDLTDWTDCTGRLLGGLVGALRGRERSDGIRLKSGKPGIEQPLQQPRRGPPAVEIVAVKVRIHLAGRALPWPKPEHAGL